MRLQGKLPPGQRIKVSANLPNSSVDLWRSWQWFGVHGDSIVLVLRHTSGHSSGHTPGDCHGSDLSVCSLSADPVSVESAVVWRRLRRGVDGPGPLVDGRPSHGAHAHAAAPPPAVYGGERHVGVLVLYLHTTSVTDCSSLLCPYLHIFGLVFEVYPGVGVAPHQDGEEQGGDDGADQHGEQPEESLAASGIQGVIVEPGEGRVEMQGKIENHLVLDIPFVGHHLDKCRGKIVPFTILCILWFRWLIG